MDATQSSKAISLKNNASVDTSATQPPYTQALGFETIADAYGINLDHS